jgi:hypothetical protein
MSLASSVAVSEAVVVLPLVPVTPTVGQGHMRSTRSASLTSAGAVRGESR